MEWRSLLSIGSSATRSFVGRASAAAAPIGSTAARRSSSSGRSGAYLVTDAGLGAPIVQELVERLAALVGPQEDLRLTRSRSVPRPG